MSKQLSFNLFCPANWSEIHSEMSEFSINWSERCFEWIFGSLCTSVLFLRLKSRIWLFKLILPIELYHLTVFSVEHFTQLNCEAFTSRSLKRIKVLYPSGIYANDRQSRYYLNQKTNLWSMWLASDKSKNRLDTRYSWWLWMFVFNFSAPIYRFFTKFL